MGEAEQDAVVEAPPCSCGDPTDTRINHRKTIPCWTYIGHTKFDVFDGQFIRRGNRREGE